MLVTRTKPNVLPMNGPRRPGYRLPSLGLRHLFKATVHRNSKGEHIVGHSASKYAGVPLFAGEYSRVLPKQNVRWRRTRGRRPRSAQWYAGLASARGHRPSPGARHDYARHVPLVHRRAWRSPSAQLDVISPLLPRHSEGLVLPNSV